MKWAAGIFVVFVFFYFCAPFLFKAMAKHDYDTMYTRMRDAKRAAGSFVHQEDKRYISYAERYARGQKMHD